MWAGRFGATALVLAAWSLPAPIRAETPVRYTNLDLEKFGPAASAPGTPVTAASGDWTAVQQFLDREYARIDADREDVLARREADRRDMETAGVLSDDDRWWTPGYGVGSYYPIGGLVGGGYCNSYGCFAFGPGIGPMTPWHRGGFHPADGHGGSHGNRTARPGSRHGSTSGGGHPLAGAPIRHDRPPSRSGSTHGRPSGAGHPLAGAPVRHGRTR